MENPDFLKKKYDLHNASEVKSASSRTEKRTGEKVPQIPGEQIQNYLNRFKEIIERKDPEEKEMGMQALKKVLHDKFVIKEDEIPETYYENQARLAREQGHGDIEIGEQQKKELAEVVIVDQESSLDNWIDYLSSQDATYPDWLKYYAFRSVTQMGAYDKGKKEFGKRSKGTTKPFPDINREALAYVLDAVSQKYGKRHTELLNLGEEEKKEFEKFLQGENFSKLYSWAIEKMAIAPTESLEKVAGKWIKYNQGSNHIPLVESLRGHGTGWCTAGESTAQTQLSNGDFYVYYSLDPKGKPIVPRAAIRMQEGKIAEVRGIAKEQNLDSYIAPVVEEKMKEFPDGKSYEKKSVDMKHLTEIENKVKVKQELIKDDLVFLYEINGTIEGFGYQKDPRIKELRDQRNTKEDAPIVFDCKPEEIVYGMNEINKNTKAYIGEWNPEISKKLPENIQYLYEEFPNKKLFRKDIELNPKTSEQYKQEILAGGMKLYGEAEFMLNKMEVLEKKEGLSLVSFSVSQLGFSNGATTKQIYDKAKEFGLESCPAQVGPELRIAYRDQKNGEYLIIAMDSISGSDGYPRCFVVYRNDDGGEWLIDNYGNLDNKWRTDDQFVFVSRKIRT